MEFLKQIITRSFTSELCAICERPKQLTELDSNRLIHSQIQQRLCHYCYDSLPHIEPRGTQSGQPCFRCGIEIPFAISGSSAISKQSCGACLAKDPIQYRSISAFHYLFPLPELIAQIKFQRQLEHINLLAELFSKKCLQSYQDDSLPQVIIPVPLHPNREFQRSFNQAELLSKRIAKQLGIKNQSNLVQRVRHTSSQMELSIPERKKNMKNAFALAPRLAKPLPIEHLAIFDDVLTTGATAQSICLLLKRAGVKRIDIWSLARTPKPK